MEDTTLQDEILQRVDALAESLGTTAEYLWSVLVRDAFVRGLVGAIVCGVAAIVLAFFAFRAGRSACRLPVVKPRGVYVCENDGKRMSLTIVCISLGFVALCCAIGAGGYALDAASPHLKALEILRGGK